MRNYNDRYPFACYFEHSSFIVQRSIILSSLRIIRIKYVIVWRYLHLGRHDGSGLDSSTLVGMAIWMRSSRLRYATLRMTMWMSRNDIIRMRSSRLRYATLENDGSGLDSSTTLHYAQNDNVYAQDDNYIFRNDVIRMRSLRLRYATLRMTMWMSRNDNMDGSK